MFRILSTFCWSYYQKLKSSQSSWQNLPPASSNRTLKKFLIKEHKDNVGIVRQFPILLLKKILFLIFNLLKSTATFHLQCFQQRSQKCDPEKDHTNTDFWAVLIEFKDGAFVRPHSNIVADAHVLKCGVVTVHNLVHQISPASISSSMSNKQSLQ